MLISCKTTKEMIFPVFISTSQPRWGAVVFSLKTYYMNNRSYQKINHYTWVLGEAKGKGKIKERFTEIKIPTPLETLEKKKLTLSLIRTDDYQNFCKEIFKFRKFMCLPEFRRRLREEIHSNTTWYIQRMENLGFIKITNHVIKPGENL